jgi:hypothetical protein
MTTKTNSPPVPRRLSSSHHNDDENEDISRMYQPDRPTSSSSAYLPDHLLGNSNTRANTPVPPRSCYINTAIHRGAASGYIPPASWKPPTLEMSYAETEDTHPFRRPLNTGHRTGMDDVQNDPPGDPPAPSSSPTLLSPSQGRGQVFIPPSPEMSLGKKEGEQTSHDTSRDLRSCLRQSRKM